MRGAHLCRYHDRCAGRSTPCPECTPASLRAFTLVGAAYELSGEFTGPVTLDVAGQAVAVDPSGLTRR